MTWIKIDKKCRSKDCILKRLFKMQASLHAFGQGQACVFSLLVLQRMLKDLTAAVLVLDLRGCETFILSLSLC